MIRKILVPVRGDGKGNNVLAHAAALAKRFNAHVLVANCRPRPKDLLPYGVPLPAFLKKQILDQATELGDQTSSGLKAEYEGLSSSLGLTIADGSSQDMATTAWVEEEGRQVEVIRHHGRLADIVAVAQPDKDGVLGINSLRSALFHTGRPVLMCPETDSVSPEIGSRIAIAWNGSSEAARAVALTLGLIDSAESVTILTTGETSHTATAEDLVEYLRIRGIESTVTRFTPEKSIGESLLDSAAAAGANLLIMGAYGESHEKEVVFGGNTQTVVQAATMPVVMVH